MEAIRRVTAMLVLLIVGALVVGCGSQVSTSTSTSTATSTAPTATATTAPPQPPTVDPALIARCNAQQTAADAVIQAGDILIFKPTLELGYPSVRLPDQTPLKPLQVPVQVSVNALHAGQFPGATPVNPGGLTNSTRSVKFSAGICNGSASQSHVVQSVSVRIATLTPYGGQVTVWPGCDGAFSQQHPNAHSGGCGGGYASDEQVKATFTSGAQAGATVVATQTGFSGTEANPDVTPLPFTLASGKALVFSVTVAVPDMAGTYAFSIGFQIDGAPAAFGPSADPFLAALVAHTFTGAACNTPAMLAQIPPATTPETYYICPQ